MKKYFIRLNFFQKTFALLAIIILINIVLLLYNTLRKIYVPNVIIGVHQSAYLYIPTGSDIDDVCRILYKNNYIVNRSSFEWLAERKKYAGHIKPGRYKLKNRMSNNELIGILRTGKQEPVRLSLNNIRNVYQLAGNVAAHIEADSLSITNLLTDDKYLSSFGFNRQTILSMFLPNTYEFLWNTSAEKFFKRMNIEYKKFWNDTRQKMADKIGLTDIQVIILASVISDETNISFEYPAIAGVYMNRLKRNMPLQADPTIKFITGNFGLKRILRKYTEIISSYNTYLNTGLPPGPISMPNIKAVEAVLNYEKHSYLYFCAKPDFSGYHVFAKTLVQHNQNAEAYQIALNKRRIF